MLAKGQRPVIGRLSELLVSRCRPAFLDTGSASPTSHFDVSFMLSPSPRGNLKSFNGGAGGGVGLGIVAALDNSSAGIRGCEILVKHAVCSPKLSSSVRSAPIPVGLGGGVFSPEEEELESMEENYTYVTTRGPHNSSTRVYYDGGECDPSSLVGRFDGGCCRKSPPTPRFAEQAAARPTPDFLRSCHTCGKNLEGRDIYMYRGETAFCSPECRSSQIMKDEMKERCRSEATRSAEVSNSPYNRGQIFSTGILAI